MKKIERKQKQHTLSRSFTHLASVTRNEITFHDFEIKDHKLEERVLAMFDQLCCAGMIVVQFSIHSLETHQLWNLRNNMLTLV